MYSQFCRNSQLFVAVATGVGGANLNDTLMKLADLENPRLVQESGRYLLHSQSYSRLCVETPKFLLNENFTDSRSFTVSPTPNKFGTYYIE